jgi:hypothetical protein
MERISIFNNNEIHLSCVHIPEIAELHIPAFGILEKETPFEKMTGHKVLKSLSHILDHCPVKRQKAAIPQFTIPGFRPVRLA